jgi:hypothetical protein
MTIPVNPKTASWTNPTQGIDPTGATVAWDPTADLAGIEIQLDGAAAVSVPVALGATSFDLTSLAAYKALASGQHTFDIAVVTKEGAVSPFSSTVTFLRAVVPLAPTNPVVA